MLPLCGQHSCGGALMTVGPRTGCFTLLVAMTFVAGLRGDDPPPSIYSAVTNAVADARTARTKQLGFSIARDKCSETNSRGGVLIGFDLGMREWFDSEIPTAVRPIYRTASGESNGTNHGS